MRGIVSESEILLTWLSEDGDRVSFVNSEGVWRFKSSGDNLRGKEDLYQFKSPVVSAWMDPTSGYLFAASPETITIVKTRDWTLKYEHKLTGIEDGPNEMWLCSVPGTWLLEYTSNVTIARSLIVYVIKKKLIVLDVKTRKTWSRVLSSHQSRGQFLSQFISLFIPDVHVTSLVGALSLLTRSLTCKSHSVYLKRKVLNRSGDFDELLANHKAEKEGTQSYQISNSGQSLQHPI